MRIGPVAVFLALSVLFGPLIVALNPPLRGPDELAHYLRAHALAQGELIADTAIDDRLGIFLPAELAAEIDAFEAYRGRLGDDDFTYRDVLPRILAGGDTAENAADDERVFVPYQGSEAYNPVGYLPHIAAAWIADRAGLGFLAESYLMRVAGFAAFTALVAWAIALTPRLKWAFVLIGLWPAAIFSRAVISADGAALAYTMVATALCLATAAGAAKSAAMRSFWLTLTALVKPPQLALVLIELIARPWGRRSLVVAALVVLPALVAGPLWVVATSAEVAAYRMTGDGATPLHEFDPVWKLGYMIEHPTHFPERLAASLQHDGDALLRQLVGVHGWLDTPLHGLVYPTLALLLLAVAAEPLNLAAGARARVAAVATVVTTSYLLGIYLIFYLVWTPLDAQTVYGVQGRYFVVLLPLVVLFVAALRTRPPPQPLVPAAATLGSIISGAATLEALWRVNWS
ncbi:MAG: DUF2142 domain-containing protein [Alphaproteobacteria bacterium]